MNVLYKVVKCNDTIILIIQMGLFMQTVAMLCGICKANLQFSEVKYGMVSSHEGVSEYPER